MTAGVTCSDRGAWPSQRIRRTVTTCWVQSAQVRLGGNCCELAGCFESLLLEQGGVEISKHQIMLARLSFWNASRHITSENNLPFPPVALAANHFASTAVDQS